MRESLEFPQIDMQKLETVKKLIVQIADASLNNDCNKALNELNLITGKIHDVTEFAEYWGWTDIDTLAKKTLIAEPPRICDLTKEEMKEIVIIIKTCLISDENKAEYYIELLHKSLPLTNVTKYVMSEKDETAIVNDMVSAASNSVIVL